MTLQLLRDKVQRLSNSQHTTAVMYFVLGSQAAYRLRKVNLVQEAQREATAAVISDLEEFFEGDYVLRDLTNADQRQCCIRLQSSTKTRPTKSVD